MGAFDFCTLQWNNNSHQRIYIPDGKRGDIERRKQHMRDQEVECKCDRTVMASLVPRLAK